MNYELLIYLAGAAAGALFLHLTRELQLLIKEAVQEYREEYREYKSAK